MRKVIIESPFAGDVEFNIKYARKCLRDSLLRGESPIASHLLYTQEGVLDDNIPEERKMGIDAGLDWREASEATIVYADYGISRGMRYGVDDAIQSGREVEYRYIVKMFEKYEHHGEDVFVSCEHKGNHRQHCLCTFCKRFKPGEEDNCPIAKDTFENCVKHNLVTPMWECPKFEDSGERNLLRK